ncbi:unnamed protein product [Knipowitschia caucasica]
MSGDRQTRSGKGIMEKKLDSSSNSDNPANATHHAAREEASVSTVSTDTTVIRTIISEVMNKGLEDLRQQMARDLTNFREIIKEDMKTQLDVLNVNINQKLEAASRQIEDATRRLEEVEIKAAGAEKWDLAVRDTLLDLINNQRALQSKMSDLEGRSRRNNIRIYGIAEKTEGTSMPAFIESFILNELRESIGVQRGADLGIERAHRALGPQPPTGAPPRSIVIRFLSFTTKEKVLQAAWKKQMFVQNKRVFFDHDYATDVQQRRKEYTPIKKILKENQIRFQTPLTRIRIHFDTGSVTCNDPHAAVAELEKRGFSVGPIRAKKPADHNADTLSKLLPWRTVGPHRAGKDYQESIRERLRGFQRPDQEDNSHEE